METSTNPAIEISTDLADAVEELLLEVPTQAAPVPAPSEPKNAAPAEPKKQATAPKKQAAAPKKQVTEPSKQAAEPSKQAAEPIRSSVNPAPEDQIPRERGPAKDAKAEATADDGPESLENIARAFEILQGVAAQPLDGATAAKIVRLNRRLRPHYNRYIAIREKVAAQYGTKIGEGKYSVPPEKVDEYQAAMGMTRAELLAVPPELKIDCKALETLKISAEALEVLAPLLTGI